MNLTPLDLFSEVSNPSGARFKWDANQAPASRPTNLRFGTKIGEGYSDGGCSLARRIDQDYPDLGLGNDLVVTGADGSTAYEGRIEAMPRELGDRHSIGVTTAGWMAHAQDKRFQETYAGRDMASFGGIPLLRRSNLATGAVATGDFSFATQETDVGTALTVSLPNQALGAQTLAETWARYQTPVATVYYRGTTTTLPGGWLVRLLATDDFSTIETYTLTLDNTVRSQALTTVRTNVGLQVYSNASAATPAAGSIVWFDMLGVYGNHGLSLYTGEPGPPGVYVSDVMRDIAARFCPRLDTSGVQSTDYVVQHAAYTSRTFPFDAFLELNKYHLWHLGVWSGKKLTFRPYDLTDYDWEIRTDDVGTTFSPQGPSTENLFNGIAVTFTAFDGSVNVLQPDAYSQLRDPSTANPWNQWGIDHWDEITLSTPTLLESALQLGVAALADRNRPKTPGTVTVKGYIRDRAGNPQPAWKVHAGDTIAITNFNDAIRLIVETDYSDEDKTVRLAIDKPFAQLDAYLDRVGNALGARGLA